MIQCFDRHILWWLLGVSLLALIFYFVSWESIQEARNSVRLFYNDTPVIAISLFSSFYIAMTSFTGFGVALGSVFAGFLFDVQLGLGVVIIASIVAAIIGFLLSRYGLKTQVQTVYEREYKHLCQKMKKEGRGIYLFAMRLLAHAPYLGLCTPICSKDRCAKLWNLGPNCRIDTPYREPPTFFLINILMGASAIGLIKFITITLLGLLPVVLVYTLFGEAVGDVYTLKDLYSWSLIKAGLLLALFPCLASWFISAFKRRQKLRQFRAPTSFDYNIAVIGGGAGGLVAANIAARMKARVALIEKDKLGGDSLHTGCVPSKSIIKTARTMALIKNAAQVGFDPCKVTFKFENVMKNVQKKINTIATHDTLDRYKKLGVDCLIGDAELVDPYRVCLHTSNPGCKRYPKAKQNKCEACEVIRAKKIIIASGARPFVPTFENLDPQHLTSETIWKLKKQPKRLLIVGGGSIGCEIGQAFAQLGSKVTIVDRNPRLMAPVDPEISGFMTRRFEEMGIEVIANTEVTGFGQKNKQKFAKCSSVKGQKRSLQIFYDEVLIALGRKPNVPSSVLDTDERGFVTTDAYLRTSLPNVFACGDCVGPYQFTHTAGYQASVAVMNALLVPYKKMDYRVVPWCIFTTPAIAHVGLSHEELMQVPHEVVTYDLRELDRAIINNEDAGMIKVLVKPGTDKVLSATIAGPHAADLIVEFIMAMKFNIGLNKIIEMIHIYPAMTEGNRNTALLWKKKQHGNWTSKLLQKYFE